MNGNTEPATEKPPRVIDRPQEGWFKTRLVKRGPWTPARIIAKASQPDRSPTLVCLIGGEERDAATAWPYLEPVSRDEYDRLVAAMDDPRKAFDPCDDVPDFGQTGGHNNRDAALKAAAEKVLGPYQDPFLNTKTGAGKVAQLVKAIIAERGARDSAYKAAAEPLRTQINWLRKEHACEAEAYREPLLGWLATWMGAHGVDKVQASGATAHFRETSEVVIEDAAKIPRLYVTPDEKAILFALRNGVKIKGCRLETTKKAQVI